MEIHNSNPLDRILSSPLPGAGLARDKKQKPKAYTSSLASRGLSIRPTIRYSIVSTYSIME
jgi:hypothetical protein